MFEGVQDQFHQFLAAAAAASSTPPIRASPNSLPLPPLSFSLLHGSNSSPPPPSTAPNSFPMFDPYPPPPPPHLQPPTHLHHHHHHHILQPPLHLQFPPSKLGGVKQEGEGESTSGFLSTSLVLERERSMGPDLIDPWSHDEVLALLRIRSAMENWFPEFTWEHVSRKLAEIGFKRSAQKCKEKFEEESRYLAVAAATTAAAAAAATTTTSIVSESCTTKNYRLFSELEELYHHGHDPPALPPPPPHHQQPALIPRNEIVLEKQNPEGKEHEQGQEEEEDGDDDQEQLGGGEGQEEREEGQDKMGQERLVEENDGSEATDHHQMIDKLDEAEKETKMERKKRRSHHQMNNKKRFEIFKRFCEEIVNKMMIQQEELHNKILEDMIKRDEEKIAKEEAWKKQEIERINKEMEARARDLAMVGDRQAKIIEFLKKFTSNSSSNAMINNNEAANKAVDTSAFSPSYNPSSSNIPILSTHQNPSSSATHSSQNHIPTSSNDESHSQTSNSLTTHIDPIAPTSNSAANNDKTQPNPRKPRPNKKPYRPYSDNFSDSNDTGKRWPRDEVLALINIRCNVDLSNNAGSDDRSQNQSNSNNNNNSKNPPLWERISQRMMDLGYKRSSKRCKEKWENINKYFRKTKNMNKKRSLDSRTCPYFHQLSHLYSQGRITGGVHGGADRGSTSSHTEGGGGGAATTTNVGDQGEANAAQVTTPPCDFEF